MRFVCTDCGKRLKARVPAGTRNISTGCNGCKKQLVIPVSVGGAGTAEQQSGRARHMAGGPINLNAPGSDTSGACEDVRCSCALSQRRLLVRHPLAQLQQLIDDAQARVDKGTLCQPAAPPSSVDRPPAA